MQAFIAGYCEISLIKSVSERRNYFEPGTDNFVADMNDDEFDDVLTKLLEERKARKKKRESDMEM